MSSSKLKFEEINKDTYSLEKSLWDDLYWQSTYFKEVEDDIKAIKSNLKGNKREDWKGKFIVEEKSNLPHKNRIENVFNSLRVINNTSNSSNLDFKQILQKEVCVNYSINDIFYKLKGEKLAISFNKMSILDIELKRLIPLKLKGSFKKDKPFRFVDIILADTETKTILLIELKAETGSKYNIFKYLRYLRIYDQTKDDINIFNGNKFEKICHIFIHPSNDFADSYITNCKDWLEGDKILKIKKDNYLNKVFSRKNKNEFKRISSNYPVFDNRSDIENLIDDFPIRTIKYKDLKEAVEEVDGKLIDLIEGVWDKL